MDEPSVTKMHSDDNSWNVFLAMFTKMKDLLSDNGRIIITDSDRSNFFNDLGFQSPIMHTIEWEKHQSPKMWKKMLEQAGFDNVIIQWTSPNRWGRLGNIFLGNRLIAYFLFSHFRLEATKG